MKRFRVGRAAIKILCALALVAVLGLVVERLWNWLVPSIMGWKAISYGRALGLLVLSKLLFGGIHRHGGGSRARWRQHMRARWEEMSPAEQERLRSGLRGRCGWSRTSGQAPSGSASRDAGAASAAQTTSTAQAEGASL